MSDDKIGGYKNDAGYTTKGHAQTQQKTPEKQGGSNTESAPWQKSSDQVENWQGLSEHNQKMMVRGVEKKIHDTIQRFKKADSEPPEELETALNKVQEYL